MLTFKKILEPQYLKKFHCIASACQDSCCTGWDVVVDKATYDIYQQSQNILLKPMFHDHIMINIDSTGNSSYARIAMNNYVCPFLTEDRLCIIQKTLNEESLSITCDTYPRTFNNLDGLLERSLCVSCPSAAELVLMNEEPMQFNSSETVVLVRNNQIPVLNTGDDVNAKPYRYFQEIRNFIITLLQDRTYPLWQRLVILSVFCDRLDQVSAELYDEDIPYIIAYFKDKIQKGEFRESMDNAGDRSEIQLQVMRILIDHRLNGNFVSKKFLVYVNEFVKGLGGIDGICQETISLRYKEAYTTYYQPFMEKHEYVLENYLVNYVFKNLFPFRPQKSIYFDQKSIYTEYILLVIHYSLIKTLLIGIAGYHQENFNSKHVITLIQTFAKSIEHNLPYLKQAVQFIEASNMNNTSGMTILIKN
ncbi:flagellin lysine-N-methylase [Pelosinus sp. UFO1]|uniref:flagellin lysine-N-methylase n=1 Tax=Pelosinus sp. UFO1 TaxID=484770 RepID=UPI0004D13FCD|nr:flagellin lysine-N-methylase [Pelosinus sp. UFO1]AIF50296.1 hypothetical protein UFO1_0741 [Pelosinus sp. UFO1]